jgi:hypothetical protein
MGSRHSRNPARERPFCAEFSSAPQACVNAVEEPSAVEDVGTATPCPARRWTRFSQNASAFHRGSGGACGRRGKQGSVGTHAKPVFQYSSIAQPGFRKLARKSSRFTATASEGFPLFLPQLRGLLSCSLLSPPISPPVAPSPSDSDDPVPIRLLESRPRVGAAEHAAEPPRPREMVHRIQKCALFSTHTGEQKVNTIKTEQETDPFARPECVVE